jgi:RNA polymerase sigma factor (sigma-70 family)
VLAGVTDQLSALVRVLAVTATVCPTVASVVEADNDTELASAADLLQAYRSDVAARRLNIIFFIHVFLAEEFCLTFTVEQMPLGDDLVGRKKSFFKPNLLTYAQHLRRNSMQDQLEQLINRCIKGERHSQANLYALLAPKMFVVCLRYARSREEAEEVLQEGFMKVFDHLDQYKFTGSFEGWVRKIMVNCALQKYRNKSQLHAVLSIEDMRTEYGDTDNIHAAMSTKELLKLVQHLPPAYRMVFNLYVFEGMKHREIAEHLGISEGTSKSNLSDARAILQKAIAKNAQTAKQNTI